MSNNCLINESSEDSDKISVASMDRNTKKTLDTRKKIN